MGVVIGMGPLKRPATIEVHDETGRVLAAGRFGSDRCGCAQMPAELPGPRRTTGCITFRWDCSGAGRTVHR